MKILFVAHSSELNGGANRSLLSIISFFSENQNYDVEVLLPSSIGKMNDTLDKMNIKWFTVKYNIIVSKNQSGLNGIFRALNILRKFTQDFFTSILIRRKISKSNYDLIYTNTRVIFIGAFIAKWLKIPHIWHVREFINENNLKTIYSSERMMDFFSSKLIVISNSIKDSLIYKKIRPEKISVVYNGLKIPENLIEKQLNNKETNVLIAGTLIPAKGQLDAVKAMKIIQDKGFNDVNLYIAGTDPEKNQKNNYRNLIEEFIKSYQVRNVIFLGEVENLDNIRKVTKIELMCSSNEAFGRVTIEGMLAKNIVIGSNSGATPEIISHGKTGFLYEAGDFIDLAKQIESVLVNNYSLGEIRKSSELLVYENFNIVKNLKKIEKIILKEV